MLCCAVLYFLSTRGTAAVETFSIFKHPLHLHQNRFTLQASAFLLSSLLRLLVSPYMGTLKMFDSNIQPGIWSTDTTVPSHWPCEQTGSPTTLISSGISTSSAAVMQQHTGTSGKVRGLDLWMIRPPDPLSHTLMSVTISSHPRKPGLCPAPSPGGRSRRTRRGMG